MIDQNTIRINFRIFKFRIHVLAAGDCAHAQLVALAFCAVYGNAIASMASFDADSGPLGSERSLSFDALAKNR